MNRAKANIMNAEDAMVFKATFFFLSTPLVLLMLTGMLIAV